MKPLPRAFYERDTLSVAKDLLGKYLIHQDKIGKIVEVEAYVGTHDLACHSSKGRTKRTEVLFGPAGHAYVYLIYGMYYCTNVVTQGNGEGSAILLRALEPIQNIEGRTQGPGLLSKAMQIDKTLNAHDLLSPDFYLAAKENEPPFSIVEKPRIGVHYAGDWAQQPFRFYMKDNPFISKP